ncbi:MAG: amidohydrolase family protein [Sandaracinaceae bacterium]
MRTLIENARIIDGTGGPSRQGAVLIEDERIAELGETSLTPDEIIDVEGAVVAPGFIDVHSHSDFSLPGFPDARAKVLQGVTTEVVCNCGLGIFPANQRVEDFYELISPVIFGEPTAGCYRDLDAYRAALEGRGVAVNVACLIAHGNVRGAVMGMDERHATDGELDGMREICATQMEQGAFGLSTGLVYPPGAYAPTEEIVELARVVARDGGIYATHMRDEGSDVVRSVQETLRIGREAKVSVQISHHKAAGRFNWGKTKKTLALVDEARAQGVDVHSDVYPYTAGSTVLSAMFVPLWAFEGSQDAMLARLKDPATRARIIADSKKRLLAFARLPGVLDRWFPKRLFLPLLLREMSKVVVISSTKRQHHYEGMSLEALAKSRGQPLFDAMLDLLVEEDAAVAAIAHVMDEADVQRVMAHPKTMIGSDGFPQREGKPHPRTFGTYPRVIERYVKELGLLSLESAVHKMTGMVAEKLAIADRGVLREGAFADLVVFSPERVHDRATFESPQNPPLGFSHVMVNGAFIVRDGEATAARPGRVLRRASPQ